MAFLEFRPPRILHQYCSTEGFHGITSSKKLWFTDLASGNDPREIRMGHKKFIDAIRFLADRERNPGRRNFLSVVADKVAAYLRNSRAYSACFSMARDHLPMWTTYGGQHGGLSIGFRSEALLDMVARVQLVEYVDEDSDNDYRKMLRQALRNTSRGLHPDSIFNLVDPVVGAFCLMTAHKHKSWAYEQEVRLVYAQRTIGPLLGEHEFFSSVGVLPDGQFARWRRPLQRIGPNGFIHYHEFPFGRFRDGVFDPTRAIAEVIIGPKCTMSINDVATVMASNGFKDFSVIKSECLVR